jgi:peptidyl-prolyl cis-trans isomerase C
MKLIRMFLTVAFAAIVGGCADTTDSVADANWLGDASIGTINGEDIPESLFRRLGLNTIQKTAEEMTPDERAAVLEQLVDLYLTAADGERQGLQQERSVAAELELQRLRYLATAAIERHLEVNPPREAELRELYEARIENLSGTEYKARHILVETEEEAAELIEQLDRGADFAELAQEFSTGPTGPNGGDLGWFAPDRMVEPFSEAVQALEVGGYTAAPVETRFGWHVIFLEDTRDQQPPGIESMRVELTSAAQRQRVESYLDSLRNAAEVEVK